MSETARNLSNSSSISSLLGASGGNAHQRLEGFHESATAPTSPTGYQSSKSSNLFSGFDSGYQRLEGNRYNYS